MLQCCAKCPRIDIPIPESDHHNSNVRPKICFHVYKLIKRCNMHGIHPLNENKQCHLYEATSD